MCVELGWLKQDGCLNPLLQPHPWDFDSPNSHNWHPTRVQQQRNFWCHLAVMAHWRPQPPWTAGHHTWAKELIPVPTGQREKKEDMDVFLMIKRKKTTAFLDAKENTSVWELKTIAGIAKVRPKNQMLHKDEQCVDDNKPLVQYNLAAPSGPKHWPRWGSLSRSRLRKDRDSLTWGSRQSLKPMSRLHGLRMTGRPFST